MRSRDPLSSVPQLPQLQKPTQNENGNQTNSKYHHHLFVFVVVFVEMLSV